jgi:hypothetical protein
VASDDIEAESMDQRDDARERLAPVRTAPAPR